jgi:hypothetical protein
LLIFTLTSLTFILTLLAFALIFHPEVPQCMRRQQEDLNLAACQPVPLLRLFSFRPLFIPFSNRPFRSTIIPFIGLSLDFHLLPL